MKNFYFSKIALRKKHCGDTSRVNTLSHVLLRRVMNVCIHKNENFGGIIRHKVCKCQCHVRHQQSHLMFIPLVFIFFTTKETADQKETDDLKFFTIFDGARSYVQLQMRRYLITHHRAGAGHAGFL